MTSSATPTAPRPTTRQIGSRSPTRTRSTATATALTWPASRPAKAFSPTARRTTARTTRNTLSGNNWNVGPGIAPNALIYAYKVFGCEGSVDNSIVVAALNRAAQDGVDVVNMSLGSPFGTADDPEVAAINTMAQAGTVVVASAGNEGQNAYMVGSPSSADRAISVAALDASRATVPGAHATFSKTPATPVDLQDSNEAPFPEGQTLPVKVLRNADGTVSLGCDPAEYTAANVTGALVVTKRGTCARVARAIFGQQAGAAAVVMINSDAAYPPMEGEITENPDTGEPFHVTIPFFGAPGTAAAATALQAADGGTVTLTHIADRQPRLPAARVVHLGRSAQRRQRRQARRHRTWCRRAVGGRRHWVQGRDDLRHVAGCAGHRRLGRADDEAHPSWSTARIKAAIMNTADPSLDLTYNPRISGAGVVQVQRAIDTQAVVLAGSGQSTLSYGAEQLAGAYSETLPMTIENTGTDAAHVLDRGLVQRQRARRGDLRLTEHRDRRRGVVADRAGHALAERCAGRGAPRRGGVELRDARDDPWRGRGHAGHERSGRLLAAGAVPGRSAGPVECRTRARQPSRDRHPAPVPEWPRR